MRIGIAVILSMLAGAGLAATPTVTSVTAQQRYPWNGLVDIVVELSGTADDVAGSECTFAATNSATKQALSVTHVTPNGADTGSGSTWTRRYVWDAAADAGAVKIEDVALTVEVVLGVQLWEGGPCWAPCNVGATKPEEYGYYFWWGDTVGYRRNAGNNGWESSLNAASFSFWGDNCPTYGEANSTLKAQGYIDGAGNLVAKYDAATAHLGAPWRMPTYAEMSALERACTTTWTTRNGVYGRLVTGKGTFSTKSIFLPATGVGYRSDSYNRGSLGYYWSSSPYSDNSNCAWGLCFDSTDYFSPGRYDRYRGKSVRPVRGYAK